MRKSFFFALIFSCGNLIAQSPTEQQIIEEISTAASTVETMQCNFIQTKTLKMLNDKLHSKGKMYCSQPHCLRWEYIEPYAYIFVLNNNKILLRKGERDEVINIEENKIFQAIAHIMMESVLGKCLTEKNNFKVSAVAMGKKYIVTLIPQKRDLKQMFSKIILHYDPTLSTIVQVETYEKNGDCSLIELKNIQKNQPLDEAVFLIE